MRCIFCKSDSSKSKSIEHIIPESLGNIEHVLAPGMVCDKCNNYFSIKIEKKMLEQPYFSNLRFRQGIESKKGNYPTQKGFTINPNVSEIELVIDRNKHLNVFFQEGKLSELECKKGGSLIYPILKFPEKNNKIISRFLGKVGLEELANRFSVSDESLKELINDERLDPLRNFVRYGKPDIIWPYYLRRIYDEDNRVFEGDRDFQILHETTLLYTDYQELYVVVCIFGVEYCLNMGGPELEGYEEWIKKNEYKTPLDPEYCPNIKRSDFDELKNDELKKRRIRSHPKNLK